jgi:transglutaminase-like putative cysteine protease
MRTMRARFVAAPPEGWISLLLVAILAVAVAWSLDDAALVLGQRAWTDFLPWVSLGGVAAGFIGARARWSRPVAHLIGAAFAAIVVPLIIGSILEPTGSPAVRYQATASSTLNAFLDFAVRGLPLTRETGHYLLVLGLLCWANGQFAASAVFRHGRPIGPIIVLGTVLVANMSATVHDQIWFLVLFSMAALFLLTRLHALDERATWVRRRIGDPSTVGSLYLRGGTVFIMIAIFGSLALTATARSAPLAGFWDDARPALIEVSQWLQRIIPAAPDARSVGVPSFGQQVTIGGTWSTSNDPALEIIRTPGDARPFYWRATAYDRFTLFGWSSTDPANVGRAPGANILEATKDAIPEGAKRTQETFRITPQDTPFKVVFSPVDPLSIDQPTTLVTVGEAGYFQSVAIAQRVPYTVTAAVQDLADVDGGVTQNRLRAAGQTYPAEIVARYTGVPLNAMGPAAKALLGDIKAGLTGRDQVTPFDLATAIVDTLHNPSRFQYSINVAGVCDRDPSIVECFASHKIGFCEHFATTMAILLRAEHIPARLVEGFLPGKIDVATGRETIRTGAAHAWVEVYFPGIGWYPFDPTGGLANTEPIPVGEARPIPTIAPFPSFNLGSRPPDDQEGPGGSRRGTVSPGPGGATGSNAGAFVAISIVLVGVILLVAFLAWRRGPRGAMTPEGVYASVAGLARRFGFGPRPTQTTFEYAAALGDVLPGVRPELQTVATAKVEVAYGRRELGEDRLKALRASYRRLRVGLLRLAFRRGDRRRMR